MRVQNLPLLLLYTLLTACGGGGGDAPIIITPVTSAPVKVEFVTATPGDGEAIINWSANNPPGVTYNIYWSTTINAGLSGTLIENVDFGYRHTGLSNGTTFFYVVTAKNSLGESEVSDDDRATPSNSVLLSSLAFNDANLAQCITDVAANFNYTYLYELLSLNCSNKNINDITGVDALTSLKNINLDNNELIDISPLSGMASLASIEISSLGVVTGSIDAPDISSISGMTNLIKIVFISYGNKLNDFSALLGLVNLRHIDIRSNDASNISFLANMPDLKVLSLGFNVNISDYSLVFTLSNLEELYLGSISIVGRTKISDISQLTSLPKLRALDLNATLISDFSVIANLTNLEELHINENGINNIAFLAPLTNIKSLEMSKNNISDISVLSDKDNIVSLYLDENNISSISVLADKTEIGQLTLGNNNISDFSVVANMNSLQLFRARNSGLTNIDFLAGKNEMVELLLDDNNITSVSALAGFTKLRTVWLQNNNLAGLDVGDVDVLSASSNLTELQLANNPNMSCSELASLISVVGSPPVDTDMDSGTTDTATDGVNCTNP